MGDGGPRTARGSPVMKWLVTKFLILSRFGSQMGERPKNTENPRKGKRLRDSGDSSMNLGGGKWSTLGLSKYEISFHRHQHFFGTENGKQGADSSRRFSTKPRQNGGTGVPVSLPSSCIRSSTGLPCVTRTAFNDLEPTSGPPMTREGSEGEGGFISCSWPVRERCCRRWVGH